MSEPVRKYSAATRLFLIVLGSVSVAVGVIGMIIPMLPTTPFLLLAAWCYARSSMRFHHWLMHHRVWGKYLQDYTSGKGVPLRIKTWALFLLWITIIVSIVYIIPRIWLMTMLIIIALAVSVHILSIPTKQ